MAFSSDPTKSYPNPTPNESAAVSQINGFPARGGSVAPSEGYRKGMSITLWTLQHPDVWDTLQKERVFRADPDREDNDFKDPYAWMKGQFKRRVPGAQGLSLIWAWRTPKPDLRRWRWCLPQGEANVRIEFEVPEDKILVSDYDMWHNVLNKFYVPSSQEDENAHWGAEDSLREELLKQGLSKREAYRKVAEHFRPKIVKSWERVLDLELMAELMTDPYFCGDAPGKLFQQAVFEELHLDWVKKVTPYQGARRNDE